MAEMRFLIAGQSLGTEDCLVSEKGTFKAFLWDNGLLLIQLMDKQRGVHEFDTDVSSYKDMYQFRLDRYGELRIFSKSLTSDTERILWTSKKFFAEPVDCFVILTEDGFLQIYKGTPTEPGEAFGRYILKHESSGELDKIDQMLSIKYDLLNANPVESQSGEIYSQIIENGSDEVQVSTINGQEAVTEEYSWSHSFGGKIGVETEFKCGVPIIAEGKVKVSLELNYQCTLGGSVAKEESWGFEVPMSVPPGKKYLCSVSVAMTRIIVPFRVDAIAKLKGGDNYVNITFFGICTSNVSHDLLSKFTEYTEREEIPGRIP